MPVFKTVFKNESLSMLSYRHAFHAGSHADVLKHAALLLVLDYLQQKDKSFMYVDTHAGAGGYRLSAAEAQKNREFDTGITKLWERTDLPSSLQPYVDAVRAQNPDAKNLMWYPGSPRFAAHALRAQDSLRLFELHPQDFSALSQLFKDDSRAQVHKQDGFSGLKSVLPPVSRRALVLIDPPYELRDEHRNIIDALKDALQRFATGTYIVWYPLLEQVEAKKFAKRLEALPCTSTLRAELRVCSPTGEFGMYGSGLFIINPPWTLAAQLREMLPYLVNVLRADAGAAWSVDVVGS